MTGTYDARYERRRDTAIRNGTWQYPIAADVVAAHIAACRKAGMSIIDVARDAHLPSSTVYEASSRKYVEGPTGAAILAVVPRKTLPAGRVDARPTARRLQALVALGHEQIALADRLGMHPNHMWKLIHGSRPALTAARASAVSRLFDELCWVDGGSLAARSVAAKRGWAPPLAWDDIDDLRERPKLGAQPRKRSTCPDGPSVNVGAAA